jgi:AcrR family transcriptional regulator
VSYALAGIGIPLRRIVYGSGILVPRANFAQLPKAIPTAAKYAKIHKNEQERMTRASATTPAVDREAGRTNGEAGHTLRSDARRNREAVIVAAKRLFADQGLEAQMPEIARVANVGVGTVYRHFPAKDDLIAAIANERFDLMAERAREDLELQDPWEGLSDFMRFATQIQADDRGLCEVMSTIPELMEKGAWAAGLPELIAELVERAQGSGQLRGDLDWEDIPMIVCGLGHVTHGGPPLSAGRWPRLVEIILDGLRSPENDVLPRPLPPAD